MYFKFFKLQYWDKRSVDVRRCNCAVLPLSLYASIFLSGKRDCFFLPGFL